MQKNTVHTTTEHGRGTKLNNKIERMKIFKKQLLPIIVQPSLKFWLITILHERICVWNMNNLKN